MNDINGMDIGSLTRQREISRGSEDLEADSPDTCRRGGADTDFLQSGLSFVAFLTGLAAFSCALGALVGTAWVDTWEPIYLPRTEDMSSVFGTGYGQLGYALNADKQKTKSGVLYNSKASKPLGFVDGDQALPTEESVSASNVSRSHSIDQGPVYQSSVPSVITDTAFVSPAEETTPDATRLNQAAATTIARSPAGRPEVNRFDKDDYTEEEDYDEYLISDAAAATEDDLRQAESIDSYKSLLVVFRIGLWRACPFLTRGELPPNIVLPNLPCVGLGYSDWKPLTGRSFRLWRDIEFTPDFLNKFRYAMPCVLLGTLVSLVAVVVAITGRCVMADKTLVCSSLHILAGLSLGSALVVFVSVLHEDFYQPTALTVAGSMSQAATAAAAAAQLGTQVVLPNTPHNDLGANSRSAGQPLTIPSFRYGWSFYMALVAFINAELSAGLYIVVHSHAFKRAGRNKTPLLLTRVRHFVTHATRPSIKDSAVQTSPNRMLASQATGATAESNDRHNHPVAGCDLLAQNPIIKEHQNNPSPVYANAIPLPIDCSCQVHFAPRRPKTNVAGIYKASTMPRKMTAVAYDEAYQQTPL